MVGNVVFWTFSVQVFLRTCLTTPLAQPQEDELETFETDSLPLSELYDQKQPTQISDESSDWDEWDDFEEDPANKCNLTSFELKNKASYVCQDGTTWSVKIEKTENEKCVYSRNVVNAAGEKEIKKAAVKCDDAQEWLEDLVQYEVFSGIPDMFLFNSRNSESENTEKSPTINESFPFPKQTNK